MYINILYKHDESRSGQVVIKDHYLQSQPHIASNKNWQPTDSLIGRKGTATGHYSYFFL